MKKILFFIIIASYFDLHSQIADPKPDNLNNIENVGTAVFGVGFLMIAQATNLMPMFTFYFNSIPVLYPIGVGLMLTGSVMILLSHRKKNKPSVYSDLSLPSSTCHGDEIPQPSFKNLFQHVK